MKRSFLVLIGMILVAINASAAAQSQPITVKPGDVKWTDMKGLPGWKQAVLVGDPEKAGPYVERIKVPANAAIPAHSHPDTENITVLAGSFGIGTGDKVDKSKGQVLNAGSFYLLPANTVHFAWAGPKGVTLQVHGVGPSGMTMVEPAKK
jgi:quercetin dioxygenase-like cupin family protein